VTVAFFLYEACYVLGMSVSW